MRKKIKVNNLRQLVKSLLQESENLEIKARLAAEEICDILKNTFDEYHGEDMLEVFINDALDNHNDSVVDTLPWWDEELSHLPYWKEMFDEDGVASSFAYKVGRELASKINLMTPQSYRKISA
jgi:beta-xylosidase